MRFLTYEGAQWRYWHESKFIREVFEQPAIAGAVSSLVGSEPGVDMSMPQIVPPWFPDSQNWHFDSVPEVRDPAFDIICFYYPQDTPPEMGATLVLPGSHLRTLVDQGSLAHYRNIAGQRRLVCRAGSVAIAHGRLWHCGQPNHTGEQRAMFKIWLRARESQRGLFNTADCRDEAVELSIYETRQPWGDAAVNSINRARLWRYLSGDDSADVSQEGALTRMGL